MHGELDEICGFREINAFYARAADPKELVIIDGSDHLFNGVVSEVADAVEELLGDWMATDGARCAAPSRSLCLDWALEVPMRNEHE